MGGDGALTSQKLRAINSPLYLLRATVYSIQTLVGDAFIVRPPESTMKLDVDNILHSFTVFIWFGMGMGFYFTHW